MRSLVYLFVVYLITPLYAVKFSVGRRMTVRGRIMSFDDYTRAVATATKQFNVNANTTLWYEPESVSDPTSQPLVTCSVLIHYRPYWPSGTTIKLGECSPAQRQTTEYYSPDPMFASTWVSETSRTDLTEHELNEPWFKDSVQAAIDLYQSRQNSSNLFWRDHIYAPSRFKIPNGYYVMYTLRLTETVCVQGRDELRLVWKQLLGCPEKGDTARTLCLVGFIHKTGMKTVPTMDCLENGERIVIE